MTNLLLKVFVIFLKFKYKGNKTMHVCFCFIRVFNNGILNSISSQCDTTFHDRFKRVSKWKRPRNDQKWSLYGPKRERWTVRNVHAIHNQWIEMSTKSRSRLNNERINIQCILIWILFLRRFQAEIIH